MAWTLGAREPYRISAFNDRFDIVPKKYEFGTFRQLADWIASHATRRDERDGPSICGAEFRGGTTRRNANVLQVNVVAFDFDDQPREAIGDAMDALEECGAEFLWHTTYSEDPSSEDGRYRVVIPLSRSTTPVEHRTLMRNLARLLHVEHIVDTSCSDPARMFYLPSAPTWRPSLPECGYVPGDPLDVEYVLSQGGPVEPPLKGDHASGAEQRGEITEVLRAHWRKERDALCIAIGERAYPGPCYDLKNGWVFGLAQGVPHIMTLEELRQPVLAALSARNPGRTDFDLANLRRAFEQVEIAMRDGMSAPWWPDQNRWPLTESGNAERLLKAHAQEIRYIAAWSRFTAYDRETKCWSHQSGDGVVLGMTKEIARNIPQEYAEADEEQQKAAEAFAHASETARARQAVLTCLRGEASIRASHSSFDAEPWLLSARNAVIDLKSGQAMAHDPDMLISKRAGTCFDPHATCPLFDRFLFEVCLGDRLLVEYLLRCLGYTLTGSTEEHCLFLTYGSGRNGKSTLLTLMHRLLGDYAVVGAQHLVLTTAHEQHPTAMADLFRARMVTMNEIEEGRTLAEAEVKYLTGGDRVKARRMREDFWEFDPSHKIWMSTNDLPRIRGTDDAIWSRVRVIPFEASFLDREDRDLPTRLANELPGILNRLLTGCLDWRRDGLRPPPQVESATRGYRADQDPLRDFLCKSSPRHGLISSERLG